MIDQCQSVSNVSQSRKNGWAGLIPIDRLLIPTPGAQLLIAHVLKGLEEDVPAAAGLNGGLRDDFGTAPTTAVVIILLTSSR